MFDGKAYGEEIVGLVRGYVEREVAPLKAENEELKERIKALEERPAPEKGDPGEPGVPPEAKDVAEALRPIADELVSEAVAKAVSELPPPEKGDPGEPGKDADPLVISEMVLAEVEKAVASLPVPKDGEDGKDAAGIVDVLKDSGELVLTLQDGRLVRTGIRDGKDGEPGRDGFSLDDFDCVPVDERTIKMTFVRGEVSHSYELQFPIMVYRGVFKEGEEYERGDMATWGGNLWHCDMPTKDKPGTESWTLAAKKGRDGKDAK